MSEQDKNNNKDDNSDIESDDSHRQYDSDDLYADTCRAIDARNKIQKEQEKLTVQKLAKTVIDNKKNITWFEKNVKNTIALSVLGFIIVTNYNNDVGETTFSWKMIFSYAVI